jgi:hypothetical protein
VLNIWIEEEDAGVGLTSIMPSSEELYGLISIAFFDVSFPPACGRGEGIDEGDLQADSLSCHFRPISCGPYVLFKHPHHLSSDLPLRPRPRRECTHREEKITVSEATGVSNIIKKTIRNALQHMPFRSLRCLQTKYQTESNKNGDEEEETMREREEGR